MSSVLYPAVVEKRKVESEGTSTTEELQVCTDHAQCAVGLFVKI